jgi:2-keto-4-pentenoate hydratase/2-oxohepta-3-ene-1,7-dioic acid hydratase in catechol pathway
MKLAAYREGETTSVAVVVNDRLVEVSGAMKQGVAHPRASSAGGVADLFANGDILGRATAAIGRIAGRGDDEMHDRGERLSDVHLLPPVLRPTKVIGVGLNYHSYVSQSGEPLPSYPVLFHKTSSALTGSRSPVLIPAVTEHVVPEGELAVIIGTRGRFLAPSDVRNHIAGYTCANDITAVDLESRTSQWTDGKMLETFCPLGPVMATPDEFDDPPSIEIRTILNDEMLQEGNTDDMIFDVYALISEISTLVTLEPGDVILTGTPSYLHTARMPLLLQAGDILRVEIDGIGALENQVSTLM